VAVAMRILDCITDAIITDPDPPGLDAQLAPVQEPVRSEVSDRPFDVYALDTLRGRRNPPKRPWRGWIGWITFNGLTSDNRYQFQPHLFGFTPKSAFGL